MNKLCQSSLVECLGLRRGWRSPLVVSIALPLILAFTPSTAEATQSTALGPNQAVAADGHIYTTWTQSQAAAQSPDGMAPPTAASPTSAIYSFTDAVDTDAWQIESELGSQFSSMAIEASTGSTLVVGVTGSASQIDSPTLASLDNGTDNVRIVQDQPSMWQLDNSLNEVQQLVSESSTSAQFDPASVIGSSVDDMAGRVVVTVDGQLAQDESAFAGIPDVTVQLGARAQLADGTTWGNNPTRGQLPVAGGDAISASDGNGSDSTCSTAFPATIAGTPVDITAGHCVENDSNAPPAGTPWYLSDINGSGLVVQNAEVGPPLAGTSHYLDGSDFDVAALASTTHGTSNCIEISSGGSTTCRPIAYESVTLITGSAVTQTGARTGDTSTTVNTAAYDDSGTIQDAILTNGCALPGDSGGALWFNNSDGTVTPLGIIHGSNYNPNQTCSSTPYTEFQSWASACPEIGATNCPSNPSPAAVGMARTSDSRGYWTTSAGGQVVPSGDAGFFGDMSGTVLNKPVVGIAGSPDSRGYWLDASDGGIFAFGDGGYYGSMGGKPLNKPIVGIAATPDGKGYWEVASDGGIFAFGDAGFYGSMGGKPLNDPVVGIATTADGKGYWEVASDGGIFAFGDAGFYGSMGGTKLNKPVVGIAATSDGKGYWMCASDGGVFAFGDGGYHGSMGGTTIAQPVVGMAGTSDSGGYWEVASDRGIFAFGDAGFYGGATPTASSTGTTGADLMYAKVTGTPSGDVGVHRVTETSGYQTEITAIASSLSSSDVSANGYVTFGDFYGTGEPDLIYFKLRDTSSGDVEVHVFSAASNYQTQVLDAVTPLSASDVLANGYLEVGNVAGNGRADLVYIKTNNTVSGDVEIHALSAASNYQSWIVQTATPLVASDVSSNGFVAMTNYSGTGLADAVYVKEGGTASGNVEVHELTASSNYQTYGTQLTTSLNGANAAANGKILFGPVNGDGTADMVFAMTSNAPSTNVEMYDLPMSTSLTGMLDLGPALYTGSDVVANGVISLFP